ncbi:FAD binding domain-containing protein [Aspergillus karnatakaensis]|uniref:FAD binding domain-containing protein n=1 Tax=Aspergillus karnatakaensis TaxID=1810916 RepID=UPI003CCD8075
MALKTSKTDLLIIGAGPAGLMAACWAGQYNLSSRIIDEKPQRTETGHADGIHSRTLEIFDSFGMADPILRRGVDEVEMSYWGVNQSSKKLECQQRMRSQPPGLSRFGQVLLNQGQVEQVMIDYINSQGKVTVERQKRAEKIYFNEIEDATHPVTVEVTGQRRDKMVQVIQDGEANKSGDATMTEIIQAKYVVACDGAKSLVREQLGVNLSSKSTDSMWGVIDIVPITDFPDIRQSCAIHSDKYGSVMTAPRENKLVRFYIQLNGDTELDKKVMEQNDESPRALIEIVRKIMQPYSLDYEYCDWYSVYPIKQGLVDDYQVRHRVFLAGDAAHTHSPKAGQGMNVSIQDTYNLVWKLGSVITGALDSSILSTYHTERHPVAEELMKMDARLVEAYERTGGEISEVSKVREGYAGFMSGVEVTYPGSVLISKRNDEEESLTNIKPGKRLRTVPVVNQADCSTTELAGALPSNGAWRLLVFSGDLQQKEQVARLESFAKAFYTQRHLSRSRRGRETKVQQLIIEAILIHPGPRTAINLLELPEIFHPFNDRLGWDYGKVFVDGNEYEDNCGNAYSEYGIDKQKGCLVLCRPDQHVAWIGGIEEVSSLDGYFSGFHRVNMVN